MDHATEPQMNPGESAPKADMGQAVDLTGKRLGDYQILRRIGQGGMGQVYLAEQISLRRKVALKLLRRDLAADKTTLTRFQHEALNAAKATHANIVQIIGIGESDGLHYMALEYVEGRNLREYIEKKGPPELLVALSIMRQVAAALQRASELGVIHRDIKPENILVTRKVEVKVTDFGLSRETEGGPALHLTQTGVTMGTPLYMSPEQVEGKPVDPRTDIYSFGVTCYHMLAGHPPFRGQTPFEVAYQHVQKEAVPLTQIRPDLPADLCALVHKMMAKKPAERPPTGREIVRELVRLRDAVVGVTGSVGGSGSGLHSTSGLSLGPVPPGPSDSVATQSLSAPRRSRRLVWIGAVSVVAALGIGLFVGWLRRQGQSSLYGSPGEAVEGTLTQRESDLKKLFDDKQDLQAAIDLGLIYLKERPLTRAEQFFHDLAKTNTSPQLTTLGYLGDGMVLAFQDQPPKSNVRILIALGGEPWQRKFEDPLRKKIAEKKKGGEFQKLVLQEWAGKKWTVRELMEKNPPLKELLAHPPLREVLAEALNYNAINAQNKFWPPVLELLRKPWSPAPEPLGKGG